MWDLEKAVTTEPESQKLHKLGFGELIGDLGGDYWYEDSSIPGFRIDKLITAIVDADPIIKGSKACERITKLATSNLLVLNCYIGINNRMGLDLIWRKEKFIQLLKNGER